MSTILPEPYTAKLDSKGRLVVRNAKAAYFKVQELEGGLILLSPQKLEPAHAPISPEVQDQIQRSIINFKDGRVHGPIDVNAARKALRQ